MLTMRALILSFVAVAAAEVIHSLPSIPPDWSFVRDAVSSDPIALKISLHQQHSDELEQVVLEVSTPGHSNYGMHLTRDQLRSFTAPSADAVSAVSSWLQKFGITPSIENDWISISTTVEKANKLLDTQFSWYQYAKSESPVLRTLSYSIPDNLVRHIDLVQPTTRFGQLGARRSTIFDLHFISDDEVPAVKSAAIAQEETCSNGVTPACLKSLYGINYNVSDTSTDLVAFASYLNEYARYADLSSFQSNFLPDAEAQNFSVTLINNGLNDQASEEDSGMKRCTYTCGTVSSLSSNLSQERRI